MGRARSAKGPRAVACGASTIVHYVHVVAPLAGSRDQGTHWPRVTSTECAISNNRAGDTVCGAEPYLCTYSIVASRRLVLQE
jgi:hypothetical protein